MQRLVPGPAAGDDGDLARDRRVGADHDVRVVLDAEDVGVRGGETPQ